MIESVVCVLRSGGDYTPAHVRALMHSIERWWPRWQPLRRVVLTDTPIDMEGVEERALSDMASVYGGNGWWAKLDLFAREHDDLGTMLYLDLDTLIVGPLDALAGVTHLMLLQDFMQPARVQSGLMALPLWARQEARTQWAGAEWTLPAQYRGDGEALDALWRHSADRWQLRVPRDTIVSYKAHVRNRKGQEPPPGTRVICFHGRPRPWHSPLWTRYAI